MVCKGISFIFGFLNLQNAWHNLHSYDSNLLAHGRLRQVHAIVEAFYTRNPGISLPAKNRQVQTTVLKLLAIVELA
jgi:hypothetical protein